MTKMQGKTTLGIMLALLLLSMLSGMLNVGVVVATETIYIRADGSIDPSTAPIQRDSISVLSEPPPIEWNKTYGGTNDDGAYSVVQTSDGGYALVGYTMSFGAGSNDFWLIKTDEQGNMQWDKTYGGEKTEYAYSVVQTSDGGYALAGTAGGILFYSQWNYSLVKTDSTGNIQWNKTYWKPGYWRCIARSLIQTSDEGYALVGTATQFLGYDVEPSDFWLVKTDNAGNEQWNKTYDNQYYDYARSFVQTTDGGYIIAGTMTNYLGQFVGTWLIKTDSSGNVQWNRTYEGEGREVRALIQTGEGGYAMTGSKQVNYQPDFWLVKTDAFGNMEWEKTFHLGEDCGYSLVQTTDGGYAIAGDTYTVLWLVKTDASGNMQWNLNYPKVGFDNHASSLVQTTDGGYAIAGYTQLQIYGDYDFWLVKVAGYIRDVAVINLMPSKTVVGQGYSLNVNVTAANQGDYTETFNVTAYANAVGTDSGLVGYWSFDEGSGTTAHDISGNNNRGIIYGATWTDGKFGKALAFDGADDVVAVPDSPGLKITDAITISAWVKLEQVPTEAYELLMKYGSYITYVYVSDPSGIRFNFGRFNGGAFDHLGTHATLPYLPYNVWYYITWIYDSSGYTAIYVNGNLYSSTTEMSGKMDISSDNFEINRRWLHEGLVDEVRIYNRPLSLEEIRAVAWSGAIQTQTTTLTSGASTTITFTWNTTGFVKGNYKLWAYAWPIQDEIDTEDNNLTDGTIIVTIPGDCAGVDPMKPPWFDGQVFWQDLLVILIGYGATPADPRWTNCNLPRADFNNDNQIFWQDLLTVLVNYGKTDP